MSNIEIAVIINSFNRLSLLKECLKSLSWISRSEFNGRIAVIVYEAGSSDGSREWLETESIAFDFPLKIYLPKNGEDTSFAAGLNTGVNYALDLFPALKYLLFYETDNQILSEEPIDQAIAQLEKMDDLAACGFTVRKHDGSPAGVGMPFLKISNFALGKNIVHKLQLEAINYKWVEESNNVIFSPVDVVFTSPLLVKKNAWRESGGLDADQFPFSTCDVEWAKRLYNIGWRMGVIKTDDVIHDNLQELSSWSAKRAKNSHRGRLRYFKKHHPYLLYLVWPGILMMRHFGEYVIAKTLIKDPSRREALAGQYLDLLKTCLKQYE